MADERKKQCDHLTAARDWLDDAADSLAREEDVKSELNVILAEAELAKAKAVKKKNRPPWQKKLIALSPLAAASLIAVLYFAANPIGKKEAAKENLSPPKTAVAAPAKPSPPAKPTIEKPKVEKPQIKKPPEKAAEERSPLDGSGLSPELKAANTRQNTLPALPNSAAASATSSPAASSPAAPTASSAAHVRPSAPNSHSLNPPRPAANMQKLMQEAGKRLRQN